MTKYKKFIDEKMKEISQAKKILDVGGGKRFTKWLAEYEDLFKNSNYLTMDCDDSLGADIVCDIHNISLADNSIDAVICSSVLEHVEDPLNVVTEIHRILKKDAKAFFYVPSTYPYHARKGHYPDYWRIFDDTIDVLFKKFTKVEYVKRGGYFLALSFFVPKQHKLRFILDPIANFLDKLFQTDKRTTSAGYYIYAIK
jgi:SAM-dependent methyltransferase